MATIAYSKPYTETSSMTANDIINHARSLIGIKYRPQGRDRMGTDCGGLLLMIGQALELTDLIVLGYSQSPDGETFERLLDLVLVRVADKYDVRPADIIACDYGEGIQHTALVVRKDEPDKVMVIHAKRSHGVSEQYLHGYDKRAWKATYRFRHLL